MVQAVKYAFAVVIICFEPQLVELEIRTMLEQKLSSHAEQMSPLSRVVVIQFQEIGTKIWRIFSELEGPIEFIEYSRIAMLP